MNISFLGTGLMGTPMIRRLLSAGHTVTVYNRTEAKCLPLQQAGAVLAVSPAAALSASSCIILMLTNAAAIRETIFSESAQPHLPQRTIIQMGTISPQESETIHHDIVAVGGQYLEAPVLGSIPQAETGSLLLMVGSTESQFATWVDVLRCFGPEPMHLGEVGSGAATKLAMNQLIGSLTTAFAMSLGLVQRSGIDIEKFMTIVRESALYAPTFDKKLTRMLDRNFDKPNFPTKHLLKDMNLFVEAAHEVGLDPTAAESVSTIVKRAIALGLSDLDYSALFNAVSPESTAD
ncbi:MAG: NAD(P)-dependent oxidoreductase [Cyanobacteria bacterium P01_A01_bin.123]